MGYARGSGKSVLLLQLAQALAQAGQKVLYITAEEFGRSTFAENLRDFRIEHENLMFCKNLNERIFSDFDIIFIDSVNSAGINLEAYRKMGDKSIRAYRSSHQRRRLSRRQRLGT